MPTIIIDKQNEKTMETNILLGDYAYLYLISIIRYLF